MEKLTINYPDGKKRQFIYGDYLERIKKIGEIWTSAYYNQNSDFCFHNIQLITVEMTEDGSEIWTEVFKE